MLLRIYFAGLFVRDLDVVIDVWHHEAAKASEAHGATDLGRSDLPVVVNRCVLHLDPHQRHLPYLEHNVAHESLVHVRLD